eukprot:8193209-Pyramimonas_sp.AAC.1
MAAHYAPKIQLLFVEAVQIARDPFHVTRDPFYGYPRSATVQVTNVRGCDLDGPSLPRHLNGSMARPPSGGRGCPACADNVNMHSPSHDRDPRHCRWCDMGDYRRKCPSCKKNYGNDKPGH